MGFSKYVKKAVGGLTLGLLGSSGDSGTSSGVDPAIFKHEAYEPGPAITMQPMDYSKISSAIKQLEGTTGRPVSEGITAGVVKGTIESRIGPMAALSESAAEREFRGEEAVKVRNLSRDRMKIDFTLKQEEMRREEEAAEAAGKAGIGSMIGMAAGMALAPTGGMSMAMGGILGSTAGKGAGAMSVLCTELYRQGHISERELVLSNRFREEHVDINVYAGYLLWASPVVDMMRESKVITSIVKSIWMPVVNHMVGKLTLRGKLTYKALSLFSLVVFECQKKEVAHA